VGFDELFVFSPVLSHTLIRVQEVRFGSGPFDHGRGVPAWRVVASKY
jgi:hypothetical protein